MNRRSFLFGAAAAAAAIDIAAPALANVPTPFAPDLWPEMSNREGFVAWMKLHRGEDVNYLGQRWDRYLQLISHADVWDAADKRAYLMTPREEFVTAENLARAYEWHHLDIGFGVTITGPHTVARMTNTLAIKPGDKVLEIGTGSGYQSAYLSYLTDKLWSIEIVPPLAKRTRALYDALIARGYREYRGDHDQERRRLLWLGRRRAVRQDHRHLRHRPHSAAAAAAAEARRDHGHPGRPARRPARDQGRKERGRRRRLQRRPFRHLRRRDHPLRALHRRPSGNVGLVEALSEAARFDGPVVVMCQTFLFRLLATWRNTIAMIVGMRVDAGFAALHRSRYALDVAGPRARFDARDARRAAARRTRSSREGPSWRPRARA